MNCDYLTRPSQHAPLEPCGKIATFETTVPLNKNGRKFCYCDEHAAVAKKSFAIQPITKEAQGQ